MHFPFFFYYNRENNETCFFIFVMRKYLKKKRIIKKLVNMPINCPFQTKSEKKKYKRIKTSNLEKKMKLVVIGLTIAPATIVVSFISPEDIL